MRQPPREQKLKQVQAEWQKSHVVATLHKYSISRRALLKIQGQVLLHSRHVPSGKAHICSRGRLAQGKAASWQGTLASRRNFRLEPGRKQPHRPAKKSAQRSAQWPRSKTKQHWSIASARSSRHLQSKQQDLEVITLCRSDLRALPGAHPRKHQDAGSIGTNLPALVLMQPSNVLADLESELLPGAFLAGALAECAPYLKVGSSAVTRSD